jgi:SAM-dependent methyltransferase
LGRVVGDPENVRVVLSVGGGPIRVNPHVLNLNIAPFSGVDVVGDAHFLPFRDDCVDGIHCEAVLEHLARPQQAVREMFRVLKPGALAYAATPFLQPFHGYPSHFQNFTLVGHRLLFEETGFVVDAAGACVGPMFALCDLWCFQLRRIFPGGNLGRVLARLGWLLLLPLRSLDRFILRSERAAELCSSTFVLARKPDRGAP